MFRPSFHSEGEYGYPLLGDDALEIALEVALLPSYGDVAHGGVAVLYAIAVHRVDIVGRYLLGIECVGVGTGSPILLKRQRDAALVERLGVAAHGPSAQRALGTEESHLGGIHPHIGVGGGDNLLGVEIDHIVLLLGEDAYAHTVEVANLLRGAGGVGGVECALDKHLVETRVVVAFHYGYEVSRDAVVAPVVEHERGAVFSHVEHGIVVVALDDTRCHRLLSNAPGFVGFDIRHAHGYAQLHGVHELAPFGYVAVVEVLEFAESFGGEVLIVGEHGIGVLKLGEHGGVNLLLRIVRHGKVLAGVFAVHHHGVGDGTVHVGDAVHDAHAEYLAEGEGDGVVGLGEHVAVLRVHVLDGVGEGGFEPSLLGVEGGEFHDPGVDDSLHVAAVGTASHGIHKLVEMLAGRDYKPLHALERCAHNVVLALHLVGVGLVHAAVDVVVEARRHREQAYRRHQSRDAVYSFHVHDIVLEVDFNVETHIAGGRHHEVVDALVVIVGSSHGFGVEGSLAVYHPEVLAHEREGDVAYTA